ncbi:MAG: Peptidase S11 D-alanyl-D-alanine carboxypeptidase 1 [Candidatus Wolfebacteria bacterium GW2011_GWE1_48_7]|nr:MAG: Peptidase S11 D-alanyl-D-alanine carboxypeptidase 1 [Candidatus Wolfebacteria bacterium GW2011_GWC2_46_275]KKU42693.1 MAG: Peptidase S11 D-alanyl-D-alanine carboxypeptidase 1 [Candidatus Wolfebacteria bacterium GW2011_GWB2_46_69]KKU54572.1 MAG: Peptidase S11 D-alanyl-D-alanine carboxypeptidase 1 [Candidatus Wolfebacteria bacterium GW2011_GWC1_47_103]KKU59956.1 MAG: Peptidase S11 D-alanyl-D-alanine carboxypeptidase 1 [Candidatus Wolfebacteria bacterium GW2011_GWE2_47_12]KKU66364.1 MAG: P
MEDEGNHYAVDQTAVVKNTIEAVLQPALITEGSAPEIVSYPVLADLEPVSSSTTPETCTSRVETRFGLVRQLNGDTTVFERGIENRWPIASITKLMTAIVATEHNALASNITFTESILKAEGTAGGFATGEVVNGADVLKGMLLVSSNDAAEAIAQTYGRDAFIRIMNEKAKELRMLDTKYVDPSGLSPQNQSTASDLYKLMGYLYDEHPELLQITRQRSASISIAGVKAKRKLSNINIFAGQANFIGGKTGYITEAEGNGNLLTLFTYNNQPFVIVVLGSPDRFGETKSLLTCI